MNYLTLLNQTVTAGLESGRIGVPVFVRWTAAIAESQGMLKPLLAEMTVYTGRWLGAPLNRLYAAGTEDQGHLSLTLEFATGGSALLALTLAHGRPHVALAIYGNRGAVYHNDVITPIRDGSLAPLQSSDRSGNTVVQEAAGVLEAMEQSLAAHQPIEPRIGGRP